MNEKKYTISFIQLSTEINLIQNIEVDSPISLGSVKRSSVKSCFSRTKSNYNSGVYTNDI